MASESDDSDLRERVAELEATVEQQQATIKKMLPGRRGALKAGGLLAGGGLLGALGSDQAAAADGTQDTSAGTIGAAGDSNDIYLDQLYDPDGDEILNVDDTGDINAAFGRTWVFNDISAPNFSPDSIDTNSLTTNDLDIDGNDLVELGDFVPIGPSYSLGSRAHSVTTTSSPWTADNTYSELPIIWNQLLTSNATPAVRTTLFTSGTSQDKEIRLRNTTDQETVWGIDLAFGQNIISRVDEYTPATTSSQITLQLQFGTNDSGDIIMRQYDIQFGVTV